ncbi:MAG: ATP-binding protein [Gammaproteobacteria bacterium]|nr:ATP-binding protein [Gammaproteobacteria bacterium]
MQNKTATHPGRQNTEYTWKPLGFLNIYRLLISSFFLVILFLDLQFNPLASYNPTLFFYSALFYFVCAVLFIPMLQMQKPGFSTQVYAHISVDIIITVLLMHASGGVGSGLGTLLVIIIAGGSILVKGKRQALMLASIASLTMLTEVIYGNLENSFNNETYTQAGILGLTLFLTAIVAFAFASRIRETEALAKRRGVDLANMAQLTEHIIQRMQTGIVVIDNKEQVRLINESAWYMLGMPSTESAPGLEQISQQLAEVLLHWKRQPEIPVQGIALSNEYHHVIPRFAHLGQDEAAGSLIFLEDAAAMAQQAQQLQLASLGRLTASIAHEIRNPLGAISHAGQLLAESPNMDKHDQRLTQIISDQSQRMNTIIESIMQLGRRDSSKPEIFNLKEFTEKFLHDFLLGHSGGEGLILMDIHPEDIEVRFDRTHLHQILTNLCENGLRHTADYPGFPKVEIRGGKSEEQIRPFLEILDHGSGIDPETATHIFEPFFTTSNTGSGLGLYISRELAVCNQANIEYIPVATGGSCFRISFQDPRRQMS